jgi:hypothetical protein
VPELGDRPQEIVNRQVVDACDILIGIFWSRLGTPTRISDSGTEEAIERFLNTGRPVMLYFSQAPVNARTVNLTQYRKRPVTTVFLRQPKAVILEEWEVRGTRKF